MKEIENGRFLMASYDDINSFFRENNIVGKEIEDIMPSEHDYMIHNFGDIDNYWDMQMESAIETDGFVCVLFTDGSNLEVRFSGEGPVILGYNTAEFAEYPEYDGMCYSLKTMFGHCIGHTIKAINFEKTEHRMIFPAYCGIDMSDDDDGINKIRFILDDDTYLAASGAIDYFCFQHLDGDENFVRVPFSKLLFEINKKLVIDMKTRGFDLRAKIVENLAPIYQVRAIEKMKRGKDLRLSYVVVFKKDGVRSFLQRTEAFYEWIKSEIELSYGEYIECRDESFIIYGPGYRIIFVLEGYGKQACDIGFVENGMPTVKPMHRMCTEMSFKYFDKSSLLFGIDSEYMEKYKEAYPNPAERLVVIVKKHKKTPRR